MARRTKAKAGGSGGAPAKEASMTGGARATAELWRSDEPFPERTERGAGTVDVKVPGVITTRVDAWLLTTFLDVAEDGLDTDDFQAGHRRTVESMLGTIRLVASDGLVDAREKYALDLLETLRDATRGAEWHGPGPNRPRWMGDAPDRVGSPTVEGPPWLLPPRSEDGGPTSPLDTHRAPRALAATAPEGETPAVETKYATKRAPKRLGRLAGMVHVEVPGVISLRLDAALLMDALTAAYHGLGARADLGADFKEAILHVQSGIYLVIVEGLRDARSKHAIELRETIRETHGELGWRGPGLGRPRWATDARHD